MNYDLLQLVALGAIFLAIIYVGIRLEMLSARLNRIFFFDNRWQNDFGRAVGFHLHEGAPFTAVELLKNQTSSQEEASQRVPDR